MIDDLYSLSISNYQIFSFFKDIQPLRYFDKNNRGLV
jgi:hypothetical protein